MKTSQTQALRKLIILSLLVAMTFVLDRFLSFMTPVMKVGFMFIPPMIAGILYGPVEGMIVYAVGDLLGALLIPKGAPLIGLTVCYALSGIIYGLFLNEKPLKLFGIDFTWRKVGLIPNVLIASALVCFVVDLFLKTAVLNTLSTDKTYWGVFTSRLLPAAIMFALHVALAPIMLELCKNLKKSFINK